MDTFLFLISVLYSTVLINIFLSIPCKFSNDSGNYNLIISTLFNIYLFKSFYCKIYLESL
jgi:hypothetical protein